MFIIALFTVATLSLNNAHFLVMVARTTIYDNGILLSLETAVTVENAEVLKV